MSAERRRRLDDGGDSFTVTLTVLQWVEVAAALRHYVACPTGAAGAVCSQADATAALQEVDRVARGEDEPASPDDVLGAP